MGLCRFRANRRPDPIEDWGWVEDDKLWVLDSTAVRRMLAGGSDGDLRSLVERENSWSLSVGRNVDAIGREFEVTLLPPVEDRMEVWAAGVTYESSKFARMCESEDGGDHYARVYMADRPELFFKATPRRCVGQGGEVRIRADAVWNVPEPELAVLISATGRILGYTIGNDMSSRDIEGANPLYLPQAKVYRQCCALGPVVVPAEELDSRNLAISLAISRHGMAVFEGVTNTSRMRRTVEELAEWLFRENEFPQGVMMLTGTGIIPHDDFTLEPGDEIAITIEGIGTLRNRVVRR